MELTNTRLGYVFLQTCFPDLFRVCRGVCATSNDSCGIPKYLRETLFRVKCLRWLNIFIIFRGLIESNRGRPCLGVCFRGYTCLGGKIVKTARENT